MNLINILFVGFVKFELKRWFSAYFVRGFNSLARLPTETARVIFLSHFLKKENYHSSFASRTFSMPRQDFLYLIFFSVA